MPQREAWVGIDFGTTYSSVAYLSAVRDMAGMLSITTQFATDTSFDRPERMFVPSKVCSYIENDKVKWAFGTNAIIVANQKANSHLYSGFKMKIGRGFEPADGDYSLELSGGNRLTITETPEQIAERFLSYLQELSFREVLANREISGTSVSLPANWDAARKMKVEDIVKKAGFGKRDEDIFAIEEPIAALYRLIEEELGLLKGKEKYVLVMDYGGGTCDVAIVKICSQDDKRSNDVDNVCEVIGRGDGPRGGLIIDEIIKKEINKRIESYQLLNQFRQLTEAEHLKIEYSNQMRELSLALTKEEREQSELEYDLSLPKGRSKKIRMSVQEFRGILQEELSLMKSPINKAIQDVNISGGWEHTKKFSHQDISHVFLVGGTSLLPFVQEQLQKTFLEEGKEIFITNNEPRHAIALGAARHAFHRQTGIGLDIGIKLKKDIWLMGMGGRGIPIARKGSNLGEDGDITVRVGLPMVSEISIGLYKGDSPWLFRDERIAIGEKKWKLNRPAIFFQPIKIHWKIHESMSMHFDFRTGSEEFHFKCIAIPLGTDIDLMEDNARIEEL